MTPPEARERLRAEARETVEFWSWTPGDRARDLITNLADALDEAEARVGRLKEVLQINEDRIADLIYVLGTTQEALRQCRGRVALGGKTLITDVHRIIDQALDPYTNCRPRAALATLPALTTQTALLREPEEALVKASEGPSTLCQPLQ